MKFYQKGKKMKKEFRKICRKMNKFNRYYYSKIISKELYNALKSYKKILIFIPLEGEADINSVIKQLRREKKEIFVPFMQDLSFKMVKYSLPLKKKKFSILEPRNKNKTPVKIDVAVVPVVGIDSSFQRVGFGKGMYDRFFANLKYKPKIIFVQLKPCVSKIKVTDKYDVKGDEYISFKTRSKDGNRIINSRYYYIRSRGVFVGQKIR